MVPGLSDWRRRSGGVPQYTSPSRFVSAKQCLGSWSYSGVLLSVVWPRGCLESTCAWILPVTFRVRERRYHLGLYS